MKITNKSEYYTALTNQMHLHALVLETPTHELLADSDLTLHTPVPLLTRIKAPACFVLGSALGPAAVSRILVRPKGAAGTRCERLCMFAETLVCFVSVSTEAGTHKKSAGYASR